MSSSWQDPAVAHLFLDNRRAAVPHGSEQIRLMREVIRELLGTPTRVLDLGCGDGILTRAVLADAPQAQAVLIDHSPPMLERARVALADLGDRVRLIRADLDDPLASLVEPPFDLVVSGFAIHHLPTPRKRSLYAEIFAVLAPGGLFVHIEHVASATPRLEGLFDRLYIDHMAAHNARPREAVSHEYHTRPDKGENKLEPVWVQLEWLREIGFTEVDCLFKWLELAVFVGRHAG